MIRFIKKLEIQLIGSIFKKPLQMNRNTDELR